MKLETGRQKLEKEEIAIRERNQIGQDKEAASGVFADRVAAIRPLSISVYHFGAPAPITSESFGVCAG
jgi:hypothetical protein